MMSSCHDSTRCGQLAFPIAKICNATTEDIPQSTTERLTNAAGLHTLNHMVEGAGGHGRRVSRARARRTTGDARFYEHYWNDRLDAPRNICQQGRRSITKQRRPITEKSDDADHRATPRGPDSQSCPRTRGARLPADRRLRRARLTPTRFVQRGDRLAGSRRRFWAARALPDRCIPPAYSLPRWKSGGSARCLATPDARR
jgi:hypothetical protein